MGGTEGQLAQVSPCLVPTFMVNTQHQVKHRPAGKPSYGNRHCRSKYFNYGSQTGRGLGPWWLAAQLFIRWAKQGVWERLLDLVQQHDITLGMTFLDGTNIRAHHKAAGAQKRGSSAVSEMCARRLAALAAAMAQKPA